MDASSSTTGLGGSKEPEPHSGLGPTDAIPCASSREVRLAALVEWCRRRLEPSYQPYVSKMFDEIWESAR